MSKTSGCGSGIFVASQIEMGQVQSSSLPSREEILRRTKGGRDVINLVFDWMIHKTSLRELYSLANPEQCKKYIFLTADALDVLFNKISLEPREKEKGIVYFQKIETLTKPTSPDDPRAKQRKVICLKLAFLYVRIFQIFASLALSVLDVEPQMDLKVSEEIGRLKGFEDNIPLFGVRPLRGGAITIKDFPSSFEPFVPYLLEIPTSSRYYKFGPLTIAVGSLDPDGKKKILYEFTLPGKRGTYSVEARIAVIKYADREYVISLTDIKDQDGNPIPDVDSIRFVRSRLTDPFLHSRTRKTIPDTIKDIFTQIIYKKAVVEEPPRYDTYEKLPERYTKYETRDTGAVSEGLHTKLLLEALQKSPPVKTHCMSRALQLLSETGLKEALPKEIYSSVCQTKFLTENHSLPDGNERITKSFGIYALAQLFYDTLATNAPGISESTRAQYNDFLAKMKFVFEEESADKRPLTSLDQVKNKLPSAVCNATTINRTFTIRDRDTIGEVRQYARRMIDYQISHTANVVKLLQKLFIVPIQKGMPLQIHPRVRKYGMEELNTIAAEARNLLIAYYSECETLYRSAVERMGAKKDVLMV
jgi:hypothetical protein